MTENKKTAQHKSENMSSKSSTTIDTKKFILEVKKRPAIYDTNCLQYNDRNAKLNAWYEVCQAMLPDWEDLSEEEKSVEEKSLRNRWRNIRDYFMKELKLHISGKANSRAGKKRKRYAFYNQLLFLMPNVKAKKGSKNAVNLQRFKSEMEHIEIDIERSDTPEKEYNLTAVSLASSEPTSNQLYQQQDTVCEPSSVPFEIDVPGDVLSSGHGSQRTNEDDYDKMFLLSLLPSFRRVPEQMKLHVRIQMQQVLASAIHVNNHHSD